MQNIKLHLPTIILAFLTLASSHSYGQTRRNSVLSKGRWFKLAVTQDGIYKLDASYLSEIGLNPASVDPINLKIYGNGGKMLPQQNSQPRAEDLLENPIWVAGEEDGTFDPEDFIVFYGQGPDQYIFNSSEKTIEYINHSYSDTSYYFLTPDGDPGKRIADAENMGDDHPVIDFFIDYEVYEKDLIHLIPEGSGREWYEQIFANSTNRSFDFEFPGLVENRPVSIKSHLLASSRSTSVIDVKINGNPVGQHEIGSVPGSTYSSKARESIERFEANTIPEAGNNMVTVSLEYEGNGKGYLNYLLVAAHRSLIYEDSLLFFRSWESLDNPFNTYKIQSRSSNPVIWDISDPFNILQQNENSNGDQLTFGVESIGLRQFVIFEYSQLKSPHFVAELPNQNLQGTVGANLVIITHPSFAGEAHRLAELRRTHDNLSVAVVEVNKIYNEFSSGAQDITAIRDFLKYLWDLDPSGNGLKYVLFMGKSSFDFKNRLENNTNFVPTYESYNSLHPIFSYSSDDYFGFMEDDEGEWKESGNGDHTLDIGVGRLPVTSVADAKAIVDKLYTYSLDTKTFGSWKNTISFVADDGDNNLHQRQANQLSDTVEKYDKVFNKKKIYLDAFPQEVIPGGETSTETYNYIQQTIDNGTLIVNFTGHGGERQWTDERILDLIMIENWENEYKLPVFVTATCEFGRHDSPGIISGAEKALLRENGGAIALVTTARPVFATQNFELNNAFYQALLNASENNSPTLGEIFKNTKNNSLSGSVNRNFALLGDPSLRLAIPELNVSIDSLMTPNGLPIDTLKALSRLKLYGSIKDNNQTVINGFSGEVNIVLFEKPSKKSTLGSKEEVFEYEERDNMIFNGKASVVNGTFVSELIIPKNISYRFGKGKFSFYAHSSELKAEARGGSQDFVLGGSIQSSLTDTTPPEIYVYLGDSSFVSGGTVKPNTVLVAKIFDQSGINISKSGLGQNIQAILDNSATFYLNEYYQADLDTYQSGWVHFPLEELEPGPHTLTLKVWDVYNNPGESSVDFVVSEKGALILSTLRNFPNPFSDKTTFTFEHNRPGEDLNVILQIYNSKGEIVKNRDYDISGSYIKTSGIEWDGRNSSGAKLPPGIYFYKVIVRSKSDGASNKLNQKLILY